MKRVAYIGAVLAALSSGLYLFIYLYRWEWNRATIAGVIFIATEVGLLGTTILDRLRRIEQRLDGLRGTEQALAHLHRNAPEPRDHFSWLDGPARGGMGVFVPVLLGAGVVLSAVAWVVERLARVTAGPAMEQALAERMGPLCLPAGGFVSDDHDPLAVLAGPRR